MKRNFSGITAQQAPRPRTARQALELLSGTDQTAFKIPHCTRLATAFASRANSSTKTMLDAIEENRLARSQPTARPIRLLRHRARSNGSGFPGTCVSVVMG